jgi:hypothetical protein
MDNVSKELEKKEHFGGHAKSSGNFLILHPKPKINKSMA